MTPPRPLPCGAFARRLAQVRRATMDYFRHREDPRRAARVRLLAPRALAAQREPHFALRRRAAIIGWDRHRSMRVDQVRALPPLSDAAFLRRWIGLLCRPWGVQKRCQRSFVMLPRVQVQHLSLIHI